MTFRLEPFTTRQFPPNETGRLIFHGDECAGAALLKLHTDGAIEGVIAFGNPPTGLDGLPHFLLKPDAVGRITIHWRDTIKARAHPRYADIKEIVTVLAGEAEVQSHLGATLHVSH